MKYYFKPVVLIGEGGDITVDPPGHVGSLHNEGEDEGEGGGRGIAGTVTTDFTQPIEADLG